MPEVDYVSADDMSMAAGSQSEFNSEESSASEASEVESSPEQRRFEVRRTNMHEMRMRTD